MNDYGNDFDDFAISVMNSGLPDTSTITHWTPGVTQSLGFNQARRYTPTPQQGSPFEVTVSEIWTQLTLTSISQPVPVGVCMFDHIGVVVSDFAKSKAFYAQALAPIGHSRVVEILVDGGLRPSAGFCHEDGSDLWISQGEPTRPLHIAFRVGSRAAVDAFHAAALAAGGEDNGGPGLRPQYHPNYYGAYALDPDGHNIEAVCHDAPDAAGSA